MVKEESRWMFHNYKNIVFVENSYAIRRLTHIANKQLKLTIVPWLVCSFLTIYVYERYQWFTAVPTHLYVGLGLASSFYFVLMLGFLWKG
ncbi:MAG: hypothetical protein ACTSUE_08080 [Promethearchaeota archaeon]